MKRKSQSSDGALGENRIATLEKEPSRQVNTLGEARQQKNDNLLNLLVRDRTNEKQAH